MKVLLIDDEQAILDVFKQALQEDASIEVATALSGNEGLAQAKAIHPDVIFLDQVLPDMNGNQVLQLLKSDPATKGIAIAILSNFNQDTLVQGALQTGASDYILKYQVAPQDLREKAHKLLAESQTNASQPEVITVGSASPAASSASDTTKE